MNVLGMAFGASAAMLVFVCLFAGMPNGGLHTGALCGKEKNGIRSANAESPLQNSEGENTA